MQAMLGFYRNALYLGPFGFSDTLQSNRAIIRRNFEPC